MSTTRLRSARCDRACARRRSGGAGRDRRGSSAAQSSRAHRAQRLARRFLARAAGRGADAAGPHRPTVRCAPRTSRGLFDGRLSARASRIALAFGPADEIPYLKKQERLTFARVGITDPLSLDDYRAHGGYARLAGGAGDGAGADIVQAVTDSGLRGRGGAAFPTGIKWKTVLDAPGGARRSTSSATPTRATRARSPIAC